MTDEQTNQTQKLPTIVLKGHLPLADYIKHWSPQRGCPEIKDAYKALPLYEKSLETMPENQIKALFLNWFLPFKTPAHLDGNEIENLIRIHVANFVEFPADLVEESMRHIANHFTWGTPKPGDYRGAIEPEWTRRKARRNVLKRYISWYENHEKPRIEEEEKLQADLALERRERDAKEDQRAA